MRNRELRIEHGYVVGRDEDSVHRELMAKGYSVGGYVDKGIPRYMLYRVTSAPHFKYETVHEFNTPEELNNMVKLLLDE